MKRITIYELPIKAPKGASNVYDNSDIVIYEDNGIYWLADNQNADPWECGSAEEVIEYFEQFA